MKVGCWFAVKGLAASPDAGRSKQPVQSITNNTTFLHQERGWIPASEAWRARLVASEIRDRASKWENDAMDMGPRSLAVAWREPSTVAQG